MIIKPFANRQLLVEDCQISIFKNIHLTSTDSSYLDQHYPTCTFVYYLKI